MNNHFKLAAFGLVTLSAMLMCDLAQATDMHFEVAPQDNATAGSRMRVSMKYNAIDPQPAQIEFINVPGLTANVTGVDVILVYRDATGAIVTTTPGIFENGCQAVSTREGVDAICDVVGATE